MTIKRRDFIKIISAGAASLTGALRKVARAKGRLSSPATQRIIKFDTDEGTFMNVDVSPDGKTLVFDLLGDIYTLPISGGRAKPLLSGRAWDRCPRYSPDGRRIAFVSDRAVSEGLDLDNLWAIDLETHQLQQVTNSHQLHLAAYGPDVQEWWGTAFRKASVDGAPTWLPGGHEIAFGMHNSKSRIRIAPSDGSTMRNGALRLLEPNAQSTLDHEAHVAWSVSFTPDNKTAFFSETRLPGLPSIEFAETRLFCLDLTTQQRKLLTEPVTDRHEFAPQVSRSGRFLAYARRNSRSETELRVRDLQTATDRRLTTIVDADEPFRFPDWSAEIPSYAFTPDDRFMVISYGGKLHKISIADGSDALIPFSVHVVRQISERVRARYRISDGSLHVRAIRWPSLSKNGKRLVFSAIGYLWSVDVPGGTPQRLTASADLEYAPAVSPDGQMVAYIAWTPKADGVGVGRGRLMILTLGLNQPQEVIEDDASYYIPSWSPDGKKVAVVRESGSVDFGWVDLASPSFHPVARAHPPSAQSFEGIYAQLVSFSSDGSQILFTKGEPNLSHRKVLRAAKLDGTKVRDIVVVDDAEAIVPSSDLSRVLIIGYDQEAYVAKLPSNGASPVRLTPSDYTANRISNGGAEFPTWLDNQTLTYGWLNEVYRYKIGSASALPLHSVALMVLRKQGSGMIAFLNARLITVSPDKEHRDVIERGTLVVEGRRILAVGSTDHVAVPSAAIVIDASGLTILPGLIDTHYHYDSGIPGVSPAPRGQLADPSTIAYGVTTIWEANGNKDDSDLSRAELRESGRSIGARWFSCNQALWGNLGPMGILGPNGPSRQAAEMLASKKVSLGAQQILKEYNSCSRAETQLDVDIARRLGVGIASHTEGLTHLLKRATDGYAVEHSGIMTPLYKDVTQFLTRSKVIWTPTNVSANFGTTPHHQALRSLLEEVRKRGPRDRDKLGHYAARYLKEQHIDEAPLGPYNQTRNASVGRAAASVLKAGGRVAVSAHNHPGILTHFEMWSLVRGGATPKQAIRAATMIGADKLGIQQDVGSLEPGKIADFLVLTANPLEKIENSLSLKYTVADGVIYDSDTLEVLDPSRLASRKPESVSN